VTPPVEIGVAGAAQRAWPAGGRRVTKAITTEMPEKSRAEATGGAGPQQIEVDDAGDADRDAMPAPCQTVGQAVFSRRSARVVAWERNGGSRS
jgi:hypothetical protein